MDGQPLTRISRVIEITGAQPVTTAPDVAPPPATEATVAPPAAAPVTVPAPANASSASPDDIMRRVGGYVEQYGGQASLLVAVEHYSQSVTVERVVTADSRGPVRGLGTNRTAETIVTLGAPATEKRRLVSEFALVANKSVSGGWLGYRDVIEVDGKPLADRGGRLQGLFQSDAPDQQEARRITEEGSRYNIGPAAARRSSRSSIERIRRWRCGCPRG
jgi:hypothetical protein